MTKTIHFLMYDQCIVHGGFFDTFEYYYLVKNVFKDHEVKWICMTDHHKEEIIRFIEDKYEDIDPKVYDDIEVTKYERGKLHRKPLVVDLIVCPTNSAMYWFLEQRNFKAAKMYIGLADYKNIHSRQNVIYKNHLVLCDERVFNYGDSCNWIPYRKKILFDKFKKVKYPDGKYDYLLNLSLIDRRFPKEYMLKLFNSFEGTFACYTGFKNKDYYSWIDDLEDASLIIPPVDKFMGLFKTFIYLPYNDGSDATPRLIPECIYYGKDIKYYDESIESKSGGYYRYEDTLKNFKGLWLKENDEIISIIEGL